MPPHLPPQASPAPRSLARSLALSIALALAAAPFAAGCKGGGGGGAGSGAQAPAEAAHGHDHGGAHGPHDGALAKLAGGAGYVELKLHDDKGDLELWLSQDDKVTQPLDLPLDAEVKVTFPERGGEALTLRARNSQHNEDEDGTPNIRDGKTNYFIFPPPEGAPAAWLQGKAFKAQVVVSFSRAGQATASEPFTLTPHHH